MPRVIRTPLPTLRIRPAVLAIDDSIPNVSMVPTPRTTIRYHKPHILLANLENQGASSPSDADLHAASWSRGCCCLHSGICIRPLPPETPSDSQLYGLILRLVATKALSCENTRVHFNELSVFVCSVLDWPLLVPMLRLDNNARKTIPKQRQSHIQVHCIHCPICSYLNDNVGVHMGTKVSKLRLHYKCLCMVGYFRILDDNRLLDCLCVLQTQ